MRHPLSLFNFCPKCGSNAFVENDFKSKRCEDCGFIYYFNPLAATVAIITNEKGEILVATRSKEPAKGTLDLPGGFCDIGENAEQGIAREVQEETGLKTTEIKYLFSIPNIYHYSGTDIHTMDLFFLVKVEDGSTPIAADDVQSLQWIKKADLDSSKFGLRSISAGIEKIKELLLPTEK
jgi:mutator protein MutT